MERYEMIHLPGETAWYTGTTVETGSKYLLLNLFSLSN